MSAHPAPYLTALALFDEGHYFEAHEVLEDLWRVTSGRDREFYQGLIQLSVILHHVTRGNVRGAANVLQTCRRHLTPYRPSHRDQDVDRLLALCDDLTAELATAAAERRPPRVPPLPALSLEPRAPRL
jgi:predicted metal-dependent hydrolase